MYYNIWNTKFCRWTDAFQDPYYPMFLTWIETKRFWNKFSFDVSEFSIFEILSSGKPGGVNYSTYINDLEIEFSVFSNTKDVSINKNINIPINDYICKLCLNERCSKNEKSCWKCGAVIMVK